jgi:3-oxoacyl-[acyl-carrier-protein] synthase III
MDELSSPSAGIAAIEVYEPQWFLGNAWFEGTIARKFVHHTGIESRPISTDDEVTMAVRTVRNLQRETGCDLKDCAALVFASPSFVPLTVAKRLLDAGGVEQERLRRAARQVVRRLGIPQCRTVGINWFCSGYSRALSLVCHRLLPRLKISREQYVLIVTSSRISRITDYGCKQTGPLFGDMATATLVARSDSQKYPVHFEILYAGAEKRPADGVFFDFHLRENVRVPAADGSTGHVAQRLVFSLDGMGIADVAPRAMSSALEQALVATGIPADDVRFVVPHQAGTGIVRFTGTKLEGIGIRGEVVNGFTKQVGNVSSCSIPYALKKMWGRLQGTIGCPTAAVGSPGKAEVSQGCVLLRSTAVHEQLARAA